MRTLFSFIILALFSAQSIFCAQLPDTISVDVTFYDYHDNGSNPDIEMGFIGNGLDTISNMVGPELSADKKPLAGTACLFSKGIEKWFKPWEPGDSAIPVYNMNGGFVSYKKGSDTAYKNLSIEKKLIFIHQGNGIYEFGTLNDPEYKSVFFPLDNVLFGNGHSLHNLGFTMEMHGTFQYAPGLFLTVRSDDDFWLFINNKRVLDFGGIHGPFITKTVQLDSLLSLPNGSIATMDFFYAERAIAGAYLAIQTNLIQSHYSCISYSEDRKSPAFMQVDPKTSSGSAALYIVKQMLPSVNNAYSLSGRTILCAKRPQFN